MIYTASKLGRSVLNRCIAECPINIQFQRYQLATYTCSGALRFHWVFWARCWTPMDLLHTDWKLGRSVLNTSITECPGFRTKSAHLGCDQEGLTSSPAVRIKMAAGRRV